MEEAAAEEAALLERAAVKDAAVLETAEGNGAQEEVPPPTRVEEADAAETAAEAAPAESGAPPPVAAPTEAPPAATSAPSCAAEAPAESIIAEEMVAQDAAEAPPAAADAAEQSAPGECSEIVDGAAAPTPIAASPSAESGAFADGAAAEPAADAPAAVLCPPEAPAPAGAAALEAPPAAESADASPTESFPALYGAAPTRGGENAAEGAAAALQPEEAAAAEEAQRSGAAASRAQIENAFYAAWTTVLKALEDLFDAALSDDGSASAEDAATIDCEWSADARGREDAIAELDGAAFGAKAPTPKALSVPPPPAEPHEPLPPPPPSELPGGGNAAPAGTPRACAEEESDRLTRLSLQLELRSVGGEAKGALEEVERAWKTPRMAMYASDDSEAELSPHGSADADGFRIATLSKDVSADGSSVGVASAMVDSPLCEGACGPAEGAARLGKLVRRARQACFMYCSVKDCEALNGYEGRIARLLQDLQAAGPELDAMAEPPATLREDYAEVVVGLKNRRTEVLEMKQVLCFGRPVSQEAPASAAEEEVPDSPCMQFTFDWSAISGNSAEAPPTFKGARAAQGAKAAGHARSRTPSSGHVRNKTPSSGNHRRRFSVTAFLFNKGQA